MTKPEIIIVANALKPYITCHSESFGTGRQCPFCQKRRYEAAAHVLGDLREVTSASEASQRHFPERVYPGPNPAGTPELRHEEEPLELCGQAVAPFRANCMLTKGHQGQHAAMTRWASVDERSESGGGQR